MQRKGLWFAVAAGLFVCVFHPPSGVIILLAVIWGAVSAGDKDAR